MRTLHCTSPDGTDIAYDVTGSGPPLMLLHAAGQTRRDWHTTGYVARLQTDFTVITVDFRGSGESDRFFDVADYAIDKICADVTAVADACRVSHFAVWGYSFGAHVARYLSAWSERVTAVAIVGVPFGLVADEALNRYIARLEQKWGPLLQAHKAGTLNETESQSLAKSQTAALLPCLQALCAWSPIEPGDLNCPALLLAGTKNKSAMTWVTANRDALSSAGIQVEIVKGLTHQQEFNQIDLIFPTISSFFKTSDESEV